jgi:signal transduction histidine kinase
MNIILIILTTLAGAAVTHLYYKKRLSFCINKVKEEKAQLIHLEKMASLGTLAAGVAHEINNPLTFLITDLNLLLKHMDEANIDKEEAKVLLSECMEGSERIRRIVKDLLSFSHPAQGKKVFSDINNLLDSTIRILWNEIKYKVDVVKDYKASTQLWVDPNQVSQVFLNLILNAVQAIKDKGTVYLSTHEDDKYIFIKITDTGDGIKPQDYPRIFEPFYTTKNGTGLGLSVSKDIIERHKGRIETQSVVGKGSTFTVVLPKSENSIK